MLDHITLPVGDFARACAFYDAALAPLGLKRLVTFGNDGPAAAAHAGYGDSRPFFWLAEGRAIGRIHVAFAAADRARVAAFHSAALAAGATDHGPPGPRPHYHPDYFGAFVLDPEGHNIEAVCRKPVAAGAAG